MRTAEEHRAWVTEVAAPAAIQRFSLCTSDVTSDYFQLPVAGREDRYYRERVYCYELYHQLRRTWHEAPELSELTLAGEIDKRGHPLVRGNGLDKAKPDFLVHVAGDMEANALVVEVKAITTKTKWFVDDVKKVCAFLDRGNYAAGACLIYGPDQRGRLQRLRKAGLAAVSDRLDLIGRIHLLHHSVVGQAAARLSWT